jgi:hypothetical protein
MVKHKRWSGPSNIDDDQIQGHDWNVLTESVEQLQRQADEPRTLVAAAAGAGLALLGSERLLSRRGFLGLPRR